MFGIEREREGDSVLVEALVARVFGPGRFALTAYRLREGNDFVSALSFVAREGDEVIGSVRFSPIMIGDDMALLLGPLAVLVEKRGLGAGLALVERGCEEAVRLGHRWVLLVGDLAYYDRVGFRRAGGSVEMPGPVDRDRLLIRGFVGDGVFPRGLVQVSR